MSGFVCSTQYTATERAGKKNELENGWEKKKPLVWTLTYPFTPQKDVSIGGKKFAAFQKGQTFSPLSNSIILVCDSTALNATPTLLAT